MSIPVSTNLDFQNVARPINLPPSVANGQPVTHEQLQAAIEGIDWKDARVYAPGNVNLAAPGATVDGVTMVIGDTFLAANQTATVENGKYVWNGVAVPATRAPDSSTGDEMEGAIYSVAEGTSGGSQFRQTAINFVVGTGSPSFAAFGAATPLATEAIAGRVEIATQAEANAGLVDNAAITPLKLANSPYVVKGFSQLIGDGSATAFTITHNLGTQAVHIAVQRQSGTFDFILVDTSAPTVNTATVTFAAGLPPAANAYRVIISKVA